MKGKCLFIHGGPGLNSNPEKYLLPRKFSQMGLEIFFWNEPSKLRDSKAEYRESRAFDQAVDTLGQMISQELDRHPIHLIAHSFGAQYVLALLAKASTRISSVTFIAPAFNVHNADLNLIKQSIQDFYSMNQENQSKRLEELLPNIGEGFDKNKEEALLLAASNEKLFTHYWSNLKQMELYFSYFTEPEYQFDLESLVAVRKTQPQESFLDQKTAPFQLPTLHIYGGDDLAIKRKEQEERGRQLLQNASIYEIPQARHYPHIEQELFWKHFNDFISQF